MDIGQASPESKVSAQEHDDLAILLRETTPTISPQRILDIGCAEFPEGPALHACYPHATIVALERNPARLDFARRAHGQMQQCQFILGDATRLGRYVTGVFGLVFIRHPDINAHTAQWNTIIAKTRMVLAPGTPLLITTYWEKERVLAREALVASDYRIEREEKNPHARWKADTLCYDQYFLLARQSEQERNHPPRSGGVFQ